MNRHSYWKGFVFFLAIGSIALASCNNDDLDEAIRLADGILIMNSGQIVQYDSPETVLSRPANKFVHDFVGGTSRILAGYFIEQGNPQHAHKCTGYTMSGAVGHSNPNGLILLIYPEKITADYVTGPVKHKVFGQ